MTINRIALACVLAMSAFGARAVTVGEVTATVDDTQGAAPFALAPSNVSGGLLTQTSVAGYAQMPSLSPPNAYFVAGEPDAFGGSAVVTLGANVTFVSFDWGTPDDFNTLVVTLSDNSTATFLASTLNLAQGLDRYVNFSADGGHYITSLKFESSSPAFEAGNFAVSAVPEPSNMALLLAGLGLIGPIARRRKA